MRNQVARYMNTFNKNSIHKDLKREFQESPLEFIQEGLEDFLLEKKESYDNSSLATNSPKSIPSESKR